MAPTDESMLEVNAIIPMVTGTISCIGSLTVIYILLRSHLKLTITYHRLTFALAFFDVLQSSSIALSTIPVPRGTPDIVFAFGNQVTCNIQGFVNTFGQVSLILYFSSLTGYFFLAIKLGLPDEVIAKYYEPVVHTISIGYGFVGAVFTIIYSGFFTSGGNCWIAPRPMHCENDPDIECETMKDFNKLRWIFAGGPTIFSFLVVTTNMLIIFWTLLFQNQDVGLSMGSSSPVTGAANEMDDEPVFRPTRRRSNTMILENPTDDGTPGTPRSGQLNVAMSPMYADNRSRQSSLNSRGTSVLELYAASKKKRKSSKAERDRKEGMIQALLFIFTYIICYIFSFIYHALDGMDGKSLQWLFILNKIFFPLQGFFVFFIFIRPRVVNARRRKKSLSLWQAFVEAVQSRGEKKVTRRRNLLKARKRQNQAMRRSQRTECDTATPHPPLVEVGPSNPTRPAASGLESDNDRQKDVVDGDQVQENVKDSPLNEHSNDKRASKVSFSDMVLVENNLEQEIDENIHDEGENELKDKKSDEADDLSFSNDKDGQDIELGNSSSDSSSDGFESPLLRVGRRLSTQILSTTYAFDQHKERRASL